MKKISKKDKENTILFGVVEYFIQTGKPVGSTTLKEFGCAKISSATIRNYFSMLEKKGYLSQAHSSGGRKPTSLAFQKHTAECLDIKYRSHSNPFDTLVRFDQKEVAHFIQKAAEELSQQSNCAVFISTPRFDQDTIVNIKLVLIDTTRCLAVILTDFGTINSELIFLTQKISTISLKRIENYFYERLNKLPESDRLTAEELVLAQKIYQELLIKYIIGQTSSPSEKIYTVGFAKLLSYPELQETTTLTKAVNLLESTESINKLLEQPISDKSLKIYTGSQLQDFCKQSFDCSTILVPYYINNIVVGAAALLGPTRIDYQSLISTINHFSDTVSKVLTKLIYKFN